MTTRNRAFFYPADTPVALQSLALTTDLDNEARSRQAEALRAAEAGDEEALAWLRAKGLRYWQKGERVIVTPPPSFDHTDMASHP